MAVSFNQFSGLASRAPMQDGSVVSVSSRQDLKINHNKFRLVRWLVNTGIGRRLTNRRTVDAFKQSLHTYYGADVVGKLDFSALDKLKQGGKPLRMREIRSYIKEAEQAADAVGLAKADGEDLARSKDLTALLDEKLAHAAYRDMPGGRELAEALRGEVDLAVARKGLDEIYAGSVKRGKPQSGNQRLYSAQRWVDMGISDASQRLFLTGYGVPTAGGQANDKLQLLLNDNPKAKGIEEKYGLKFDANRVSPWLYGKLTEKLTTEVSNILMNPGRYLPAGEGPVDERIQQVVKQKAEQVVDKFVSERAEALEHLHRLREQGAVKAEEMASYGEYAGGDMPPHSLADVVMHHNIPASRLPKLCALRNEISGNLADLAAPDHTLEHKVGTLLKFGETLTGVYPDMSAGKEEMSAQEFKNFLEGAENFAHYTDGCASFLLEGKLSEADRGKIVADSRADPSASGLAQLCEGIGAMAPHVLYAEDKNAERQWASSRERFDGMMAGAKVLTGLDNPSLARPGDYSQRHSGVLLALRNCGINAPPPDEVDKMQSGQGPFPRMALEHAQKGLHTELAKDMKASTDHPGFPAEAVRDFPRARYVVAGKEIEFGDADGVANGIRNFCVGADGKTDDRLLDMIGKLVYQRSNAIMVDRFTSGLASSPADHDAEVQTAPFIGYAFGHTTSTYSISKTDAETVRVFFKTDCTPSTLSHSTGVRMLDGEQSRLEQDMTVEINLRDYSVKVTDMNYDYELFPTGDGLI